VSESALVSDLRRWFPGVLVGATIFILGTANGPRALAEAEVHPQAAEQAKSVVQECLDVEQAFATNDLAALEALAPLDTQWQALQAFRRAAIHIPVRDKPAARTAVREGLAAVELALKETRNTAPARRAELLLLGAMLDGQFLLIDRWRLLRHGFRGLRRLRQAENLVADSPRAALIRGTAKVVAPWALGGSASEAVEILQPAYTPSTLCADGNWGQVDLLNWLGRAHEKLGDRASARLMYEAALKRSPGNHWVRLALSGNGYEWTEHGTQEADGPRSE